MANLCATSASEAACVEMLETLLSHVTLRKKKTFDARQPDLQPECKPAAPSATGPSALSYGVEGQGVQAYRCRAARGWRIPPAWHVFPRFSAGGGGRVSPESAGTHVASSAPRTSRLHLFGGWLRPACKTAPAPAPPVTSAVATKADFDEALEFRATKLKSLGHSVLGHSDQGSLHSACSESCCSDRAEAASFRSFCSTSLRGPHAPTLRRSTSTILRKVSAYSSQGTIGSPGGAAPTQAHLLLRRRPPFTAILHRSSSTISWADHACFNAERDERAWCRSRQPLL